MSMESPHKICMCVCVRRYWDPSSTIRDCCRHRQKLWAEQSRSSAHSM